LPIWNKAISATSPGSGINFILGWALGHAAVTGRFGEGDLASILAHQARSRPGPTHTAGPDRSLSQGTGGWADLGTPEEPQ